MERDCEDIHSGKGLPFKVVDISREHRKGVVACNLEELILRAREKLSIPDSYSVKVVLEQDGTEIDDDEYFSTMERNTNLMLLVNDERWLPPGKIQRLRGIAQDDTDSGSQSRNRELENLVDRLQGDLTHISMLGGKELELLSNMDPESLTDIIPDRIFLVQLKEASGRFLSEKRQAQDALDLLKLYHSVQQEVNAVPSKKERV